jgi:steroid delta-isomerase-like uncharacterized protein
MSISRSELDALGAERDDRRMAATTSAGAPLTREFAEDFSHRWLDAWNRHEPDELAALCTDDVEFFDPAIGTVHGRAAVADWVRACIVAFPDYRFEEPEPVYVASDRPKVIAPWRMLGTFTGTMPLGFAATGRSIVIDGVDHWWFRDGLVERYRADYDSMGVARDLGLMPERGSRQERTMVRLQRLQARLTKKR